MDGGPHNILFLLLVLGRVQANKVGNSQLHLWASWFAYEWIILFSILFNYVRTTVYFMLLSTLIESIAASSPGGSAAGWRTHVGKEDAPAGWRSTGGPERRRGSATLTRGFPPPAGEAGSLS